MPGQILSFAGVLYVGLYPPQRYSCAHQSFIHSVYFSDRVHRGLCQVKHLVWGDALWSLTASARGHINGRDDKSEQ